MLLYNLVIKAPIKSLFDRDVNPIQQVPTNITSGVTVRLKKPDGTVFYSQNLQMQVPQLLPQRVVLTNRHLVMMLMVI